jgi:hypothetical protein
MNILSVITICSSVSLRNSRTNAALSASNSSFLYNYSAKLHENFIFTTGEVQDSGEGVGV